jgi:hypothetical protein
MGMLLDDANFVQTRLLGWLTQTLKAFDTRTIDATLYQLLDQRLSQMLNQNQLSLLNPQLEQAKAVLLQTTPTPAPIS